MTHIEEYANAVLSGKINACDKIKRIYERLANDLQRPQKYHFDESLANRPIDFIERFCKQSQGEMGQPLQLELFQKAKLQAIFGFVDDENLRRYTECLTVEGRKNGKTTETGGVNIYMCAGDSEGAPECYNIATKRDQAKKGFTESWNMIQQSPTLRKRFKKRQSDLYLPSNLGIIAPLASNTNGLDGLNSHCVIIDELAAIKNRDLYDLMKQSTASRRQPLVFCISTNGFVRDCIFDAQYEYAEGVLSGKIIDEHFLPIIYELDSKDEWDKEECWIKANPGLGTIKKIETLRGYVQKAKNDPAFKPTVLVKDFNLKENAEAAWLSFEVMNNTAIFDESAQQFRYCIGGMDGADNVDLNAAKAICMKPGDEKLYIYSMYWIPESVVTDRPTRRERDDAPYQLWIDQGYMRTYPGNKVNKRVFLDWFIELRDVYDIYPLYIGYDKWHIDDSLLAQFEAEFGKTTMVRVIQGTKTLSQPMKDLKADLEAKRIVYNNNPVDKMCLLNTYVKEDINGNIQPVKDNPKRRIDGTAALLDGYVVLQDKKDEYLSLI